MAPLILSAVYIRNRDATYYLSALVAASGTIVMTTIACRNDAKVLGKQNLPIGKERSNSENSSGKSPKSEVSVEMETVQEVESQVMEVQVTDVSSNPVGESTQ